MECVKQSYWYTEYNEYQYFNITQAHSNYKRFAKRQFHKARRQYDKELIENILSERKRYEKYLIDNIWDNESDILYDQLFTVNRVTLPKHHKEHNHKFKIKNVL